MLVSAGMRNRLLRAAGIDLAEDVRVLPGSHFGGMDGRIRLGAGLMVNRGCMIQAVADVTVGAGVFIGPGVKVIASTHRIGPREHRWRVDLQTDTDRRRLVDWRGRDDPPGSDHRGGLHCCGGSCGDRRLRGRWPVCGYSGAACSRPRRRSSGAARVLKKQESSANRSRRRHCDRLIWPAIIGAVNVSTGSTTSLMSPRLRLRRAFTYARWPTRTPSLA